MSVSLKRKATERIVTRSRSKRQNMEVPIPEPEPSTSDTKAEISKISELNDDCQIEIFRYCSFYDFVSIIEYDKELSATARWVFQQKAQNTLVPVSNEIDPEKGIMASPAVKLLNRFGSDIDGLKLVYDEEFRRFDHIIERAIINRCHKSLVSLRIENMARYSMFDIKKPFINLEKLNVFGGTMCDLIPKFGKWFPNASYLRLVNLKFPKKNKERMAANNCHALRELYIRPTHVTGESEFYAQWATDFVILNPQLTKLSVTYNTGMLSLLSIKKPSLPNLHLEIFSDRFPVLDVLRNLVGGSFIHFDKLAKLTLRGQVSRINVTANEIGTLDVFLTNLISSDLLNFVEKESSIESVNIIRKWDTVSDPDKVVEVIKQIKGLKKLSLSSHSSISTKEVVELVKRCPTLGYIFIHSDEEMAEYPDIKNKLGAEWMVTRDKALFNNVTKLGFLFSKISTNEQGNMNRRTAL